MDSDPAALAARIREATSRLLVTAAAVTDRQVTEPSLLPGWTRGHALTHIARNADGLRNLLSWARTGIQTPMYASSQAREAAIEAGARRGAAQLAADVARSADAFAASAANLPAGTWQVPVRGLTGPPHPAWFTLFRRLTEVEIHHVDLDLGYRPPDWPVQFVTDELDRVTGQFADRPGVPACELDVTDTGRLLRIGPSGVTRPAAVVVSGPGYALLAWLTGRDTGASLSVRGGPGPAAGPGRLPPRLPEWM